MTRDRVINRRSALIGFVVAVLCSALIAFAGGLLVGQSTSGDSCKIAVQLLESPDLLDSGGVETRHAYLVAHDRCLGLDAQHT